jgi:hypothetical protein
MEAEGLLKARWRSRPCDAPAITYASPRPDVARRNYSADTPGLTDVSVRQSVGLRRPARRWPGRHTSSAEAPPLGEVSRRN